MAKKKTESVQEIAHSKNFDKVKGYYVSFIQTGIGWTKERVRAAVHKWITEDEYAEITGETYETDA